MPENKAYKKYTEKLAKRLSNLSRAMCRMKGVERGELNYRMNAEDNDAIHDLFDAVQNKPMAAEFLEWLLDLEEQDWEKNS